MSMRPKRSPCVLAVLGPSRVGKTTVVSALLETYRHSQAAVLLVEGDPERPVLQHYAPSTLQPPSLFTLFGSLTAEEAANGPRIDCHLAEALVPLFGQVETLAVGAWPDPPKPWHHAALTYGLSRLAIKTYDLVVLDNPPDWLLGCWPANSLQVLAVLAPPPSSPWQPPPLPWSDLPPAWLVNTPVPTTRWVEPAFGPERWSFVGRVGFYPATPTQPTVAQVGQALEDCWLRLPAPLPLG